MYVCGCVWVCLVYYKELAHEIMEADKSKDLQTASWRAHGVFQSDNLQA